MVAAEVGLRALQTGPAVPCEWSIPLRHGRIADLAGHRAIHTSTKERTGTMNTRRSRREFLGDVGRGMLVASVGLGTASDMGLTPARAADDAGGPITFGGLEPLVGLMQETPVGRLVPA